MVSSPDFINLYCGSTNAAAPWLNRSARAGRRWFAGLQKSLCFQTVRDARDAALATPMRAPRPHASRVDKRSQQRHRISTFTTTTKTTSTATTKTTKTTTTRTMTPKTKRTTTPTTTTRTMTPTTRTTTTTTTTSTWTSTSTATTTTTSTSTSTSKTSGTGKNCVEQNPFDFHSGRGRK